MFSINNIVRDFILIAIFIGIALDMLAQNNPLIEIRIIPDYDSIGYSDPIAFRLSMRNLSADKSFKIYPFEAGRGAIRYGEINIEYKKGDSRWVSYLVSSLAMERYTNAQPSALIEPGQEIISDQFAINPKLVFGDDFAVPGACQIRVYYRWFAGQLEFGNVLVSDPITIFMRPYTGEDLPAYNYLQTLPDPEFVFEPIFGDPKEHSREFSPATYPYLPNARYIATNFPNSRFATWANLYIARTDYLLALNENKSFESSLAYLRESKACCLEVLAGSDPSAKEIARETLKVHMSVLQHIARSFKYANDRSQLYKEFTYDLK